MKKLFLGLSLLFSGYLSQAQINKGTVLLGGDVSLFSTTGTATGSPQNSKQQQFFVEPSGGIAIANNLVLGLDLGVGYQSGTNNSNFQDNQYQAGLFLRKYKPLGSGFYFFGATELSFGINDQTQDESVGFRQDTKTTNLELGFSPGVAYALSHHWQLEVVFPRVLDLSYSNQKYVFNIPEQGGSTQAETMQTNHEYGFFTSLSSGFLVSVGLRYMIGN